MENASWHLGRVLSQHYADQGAAISGCIFLEQSRPPFAARTDAVYCECRARRREGVVVGGVRGSSGAVECDHKGG